MATTLTLKFKGIEDKVLNDLVRVGLFNSKSEAIRAALVKYTIDIGLINREMLWKEIRKHPRRNVSAKSLTKDLEALENEI